MCCQPVMFSFAFTLLSVFIMFALIGESDQNGLAYYGGRLSYGGYGGYGYGKSYGGYSYPGYGYGYGSYWNPSYGYGNYGSYGRYGYPYGYGKYGGYRYPSYGGYLGFKTKGKREIGLESAEEAGPFQEGPEPQNSPIFEENIGF
ncbi:hypothetical protein Q1695_004614 [Nippostrongylus brasiliensis]|nr:hypothetical protein Q1695_004614 [Nippostrongylus brasiliensis]